MNKNNLVQALKESEKIIFFKNIKNDKLILKLKNYFSAENNSVSDLSDIIYQLIELSFKEGLSGDLWHNYLKMKLTAAENIFSLKAEKNLISKKSSLYQIALNDIRIIKHLFSYSFQNLIQFLDESSLENIKSFKIADSELNTYNLKKYQNLCSGNSAEKDLDDLIRFYQNYGAGILNQSRAFYWQNENLKLVNNPDPITFDQLIAYQKEKNKLIENTESFLKGYHAHNVLLYGDSGTGKSSSVKALLNKYHDQGLRLIEINSSQIKELPDILEYLNQRGLYYIIFMDDLSFEEFETDYKYLKAVMEGGIESKPENVLFYATSNRRHLVREKWQDRESEVHENDILNEKLSLSERFGLTLMYNTPSQAEYLTIVNQLASQADLKIKKDSLKRKALQWSKWNNGRSGRSARQFINQLLKEDNK
ncbi:MAG: ATP-binding protein [Halanaerobium sp.]